MRQQTKYILIAIVAALSAWLVGTYLVGIADIQEFTASGPIDMRDVHQIKRAISDPTFTTTYSWGDITLHGWYWAFILPFGAAVFSFVSVLVVAGIRRRTHAP